MREEQVSVFTRAAFRRAPAAWALTLALSRLRIRSWKVAGAFRAAEMMKSHITPAHQMLQQLEFFWFNLTGQVRKQILLISVGRLEVGNLSEPRRSVEETLRDKQEILALLTQD